MEINEWVHKCWKVLLPNIYKYILSGKLLWDNTEETRRYTEYGDTHDKHFTSSGFYPF